MNPHHHKKFNKLYPCNCVYFFVSFSTVPHPQHVKEDEKCLTAHAHWKVYKKKRCGNGSIQHQLEENCCDENFHLQRKLKKKCRKMSPNLSTELLVPLLFIGTCVEFCKGDFNCNYKSFKVKIYFASRTRRKNIYTSFFFAKNSSQF